MSVSNEFKRLKKRAKKRSYVPRSGLTPHELLERSRARREARLDALVSGSPLPAEEFLAHEREDLDALLAPHSAGALDELKSRLLEMSERREAAAVREQEREGERKRFAGQMRGADEPGDEPERLNMKAIMEAKRK